MKNTVIRAFLFLTFVSFSLKNYSQSPPACPSINAQVGIGPSTTICQGNCVNLTSTVVPVNLTNTYSIQSIPYAPYSFTTGTSILANQDDIWSSVTPLGFNFCYFGSTFSSCVIGSNGQVTFDLTQAGGSDNWAISAALPSLADMPDNTICAAFRDIDPTSSGNIYFATYGTSPCRALVVSWDNVPMFDNPGSCTGIPNSTFQLVLYETTNFIDVYIQNSTACPGWNSGYGIIGIQNNGATVGYSPAGRNYPAAWTATNEAWRFVPTGAQSYTVNWSDPSGPLGTGLTQNVCPSTTTTYTATMNVSGCASSGSSYTSAVTVSVIAGPTLAVNSATICQGESATLNATGAANYTWQPSGSNASSVTFTPAVTTIYTITGTQAGPSCVSTVTTNITVNVATAANPTNNSPICEGTTLNLFVDPANTYTWSGPGGYNSNLQNPVIPNSTVNESGIYSVTLTSISGCTTTATTSVTIIPLPVPTATNNGPLCSGEDLILTGTGSTIYNWSGPGFSSNLASPVIPNATPASTGVYNLIAGVGSCTVAVSTNVVVNASPVASMGYSGAVCEGSPIYFTGNGGTTYSWNGPNFGSSVQNPTLNVSQFINSGTYTLTVADAIGCINTATMNVVVYPIPVADFNFAPLRPVINGENDVYFTDASHNGTIVTWNWYFMNTAEFTSTSQNPHFLYENPGDYVVALVVKNTNGCTDTILKSIKVYEDYGIYVPNVFTPNGDGLNDIFQPKGFGITKYEMNIYDRWGEKVFGTKTFEEGWNGTKQSKNDVKYGILADGTYTWQINLTNTFGEAKEFSGHVVLMK
jgi:gliding motility-associated-like protein